MVVRVPVTVVVSGTTESFLIVGRGMLVHRFELLMCSDRNDLGQWRDNSQLVVCSSVF